MDTAPDPLWLAVLIVAGVVAGAINTMAGGGSLLTLPALMLLGLPADIANGTNRLSVLSQSISGVWSFHRAGKLDVRDARRVLAPSIVGSAVGAFCASRVPAAWLEPALIGALIVVALVMALGKDTPAQTAEPARPSGAAGTAALFLAAVYGGFVQAGVGFVLLAVLGPVLSLDLVRANALKLVCTTVFGVVALGIFAYAGQIAWLSAVVLAASTVTGSQLGVRFALRVRELTLRYIVLACVLASGAAVLLRK